MKKNYIILLILFFLPLITVGANISSKTDLSKKEVVDEIMSQSTDQKAEAVKRIQSLEQKKQVILRKVDSIQFSTTARKKNPVHSTHRLRTPFRAPDQHDATVVKYALDSIITKVWGGDDWEEEGDMQVFTYNDNQIASSETSYVYDNDTKKWIPSYRESFDINSKKQITEMMRESWDETLSDWIIEHKFLMSYNDNGDVTLYEEYGYSDALDQLIGASKDVFVYESSGQITQISFGWDVSSSDWMNVSKQEYLMADDEVVLYADYSWDADRSLWIGNFKVEQPLVPGFDDLRGSVNYFWDDDTDTWGIYSKTEYILSENSSEPDLVKSSWLYDSSSKELQIFNKVEYSNPRPGTYSHPDEQFGNKHAYIMDYLTGTLINGSKRESIIDSFGNITERKEFVWVNFNGSYSWILEEQMNAIIESGKVVEELTQSWYIDHYLEEAEEAERKSVLFEYDGNGQLLQTIERLWNRYSEVWEDRMKKEYGYNSQGQLIHEEEFVSSGLMWHPSGKNSFAYNTDGSESLTENYKWNNIENEYVLIEKKEYVVDEYGEVILESLGELIDDQQFVQIYYREQAFDANRNLILYTYLSIQPFIDDDGNVAVYSYGEKTETEYDVDNKFLSETTYRYQDDEQRFIPTYKDINRYLAGRGSALEEAIEMEWDEDSEKWINVSRDVPTYNFDVTFSELVLPFMDFESSSEIMAMFAYMPVSSSQYDWDPILDKWELNEVTDAYFSPREFTGVSQIETQRVMIYPNPFTEYLQIETDQKEGVFSLFDLQGRKLHETKFDNELRLDATHLIPGVYIYRVQLADGLYTGKLVKQ